MLHTAATQPHEVALRVLLDADGAPAGAFAERVDAAARRAGLTGERRGRLVDLVAGATRQRLALDHLLDGQLARPGKVDRTTREILRLGAYQLLYGREGRDHAVVDGCAALAKSVGRGSMTGLVNGVLRTLLRRIDARRDRPREPARELPVGDGLVCRFADAPYADASLVDRLALAYSYPPWLVARWARELEPALLERRLAAGNERPRLVVRVDRRRVTRAEVLARFAAAEVLAAPLDEPWAILVREPGDPTRLPGFADGELTVQDEAAMRAVELAPIEDGQRILELGAAPGGKTLQLRERAPRARIVAVDPSRRRLARVAEALARRGERGVTIVAARGEALPFADGVTFDGVLVDAPCSNTGVVAKRADLRWRLAPDDIAALVRLQAELLERALARVAPGGWLAYSTCSVEPEENEGQVARLTERGLVRVAERLDRPETSATGCGGYAAVLRRS